MRDESRFCEAIDSPVVSGPRSKFNCCFDNLKPKPNDSEPKFLVNHTVAIALTLWLAGALCSAQEAASSLGPAKAPAVLQPGLLSPESIKTPAPRFVPDDPFLTNLLMKPRLQYGGFVTEASRKNSNSFSRLFHWREPGGFETASKNFSGDTSGGRSKGWVLFSIGFP